MSGSPGAGIPSMDSRPPGGLPGLGQLTTQGRRETLAELSGSQWSASIMKKAPLLGSTPRAISPVSVEGLSHNYGQQEISIPSFGDARNPAANVDDDSNDDYIEDDNDNGVDDIDDDGNDGNDGQKALILESSGAGSDVPSSIRRRPLQYTVRRSSMVSTANKRYNISDPAAAHDVNNVIEPGSHSPAASHSNAGLAADPRAPPSTGTSQPRGIMTDPSVPPVPRTPCRNCRRYVFNHPPWVQCGRKVFGEFPLKICMVCQIINKTYYSDDVVDAVTRLENFKITANNYFAKFDKQIDEEEFQQVVAFVQATIAQRKANSGMGGSSRSAEKYYVEGSGRNWKGKLNRRRSTPGESPAASTTSDSILGTSDLGDRIASASQGPSRRVSFVTEENPTASVGALKRARTQSAAFATTSSPAFKRPDMAALMGVARRLDATSVEESEEANLRQYVEALKTGEASAYSLFVGVKKMTQKDAENARLKSDVGEISKAIAAQWGSAKKLFKDDIEDLPYQELLREAEIKLQRQALKDAILPIKQFLDQIYALAVADANSDNDDTEESQLQSQPQS